MVQMRGEKLNLSLLSLLEHLLVAYPMAFVGQESNFLATTALVLLMKNSSPNLGLVVSKFFKIWFERNPTGHPFADEVNLAIEPLCKLADEQPRTFITATEEALRFTIERAASSGVTRLRYAFMMRRRGEQYSVAGKFFTAFHAALVRVAVDDATSVEHWLSLLPPAAHEIALHLHLSAVAANPKAFSHRLGHLMGEPRIFDAGWSEEPEEAFVSAYRAALPYLQPSERSLIEARILNDRSELDLATGLLAGERDSGRAEPTDARARALSLLSSSGRERFIVLRALGAACAFIRGKCLIG